MRNLIGPSAFVASLVLAGGLCRANVKLPALFGDHMVLQGGTKLPVWGTADPGEFVSVTLGEKSASTKASADGTWRVDLPPVESDAKPLTLTVAGKNTLKIEDVLVGEVWLASGQSNMAFSLNGAHNAAAEIPKAADSELRFFSVARKPAAEPQSQTSGRWEVCTPKTAQAFSAVAYFFARDLRKSLGRPVGVIGAYWGGTPCQAWTPLASLEQDPPMTHYVKEYETALAAHRAVLANPKRAQDYEADEKRWREEVAPAYGAAMKAYFAESDAAHVSGKPLPARPVPSRPEPANPDPIGMPNTSSRPGVPSVLYNGMIAPCVPYAIRGVIWYQGEANGGRGIEYRTLFPRLITGWRHAWGEGDFPFLFVQLPGWDAGNKHGDEWAFLREAQRMTLSLPNTGMAVTIDLGDPNNVHPKDKVDVGDRLALIARHEVYGQNVADSGPVYQSMSIQGGAVRLRFTHAGGGLKIGVRPWLAPGMAEPSKDRLLGFTVAGKDRQWVPADARIEGDSVIVSAPKVSDPVAVRYGWLNAPECNLYNAEGLPASPFRTDDWAK